MKISTELIQENGVINLQTSLHLMRPAVKDKLADQIVADHFLPLKPLNFSVNIIILPVVRHFSCCFLLQLVFAMM